MSDSSEDRLQAAIAAARARRIVGQAANESSSVGGNSMGESLPGENLPGEPSERDPDEVFSFCALWQSESGSDDAAQTSSANTERIEPGGLMQELLADVDGEAGPAKMATDSEADAWLWLTSQEPGSGGSDDDVMSLFDQRRDEERHRYVRQCGSDGGGMTAGQETSQWEKTDNDLTQLELEPPVRPVASMHKRHPLQQTTQLENNRQHAQQHSNNRQHAQQHSNNRQHAQQHSNNRQHAQQHSNNRQHLTRFNKICHPSQRPRWRVDKEAIGLSRVQQCSSTYSPPS